MKIRWSGLAAVMVLVVIVLVAKNRMHHNSSFPVATASPSVILVADLREADDPHDRCADIIRAVRNAANRGVSVLELPPESNSEVLRRYHVLTVPTVLVLDSSAHELKRFEGEEPATVSEVQNTMARLSGPKR